MIFNTKVFFIARPPSLIVWNCETHQQFELSIAYQHRLSELISTPESFDQTCSIDKDFLDAGVIKYPNDSEIEWGWDRLSEIFHSGTKCIPLESQPNDLADWTKQYSAHCKETLSKPPPIESFKKSSSNHITLPPPNRAISAGLVHVLKTRKTCRNYDSSPITLEALSTILYYSLGYLRERIDSETTELPEDYNFRRSSPSGGGLNATEGYVYAKNIESIQPGVYYYNPHQHSLDFRSSIKGIELGSILNGQHFINELPFGLFLTSRLDKLWWKYEHSRAYRMALIEIGHVAQTTQLIMTGAGLQTWLTGALNEEIIEKLIHPKHGTEEVLFFIGCGFGDGKAIPLQLKNLLEADKRNGKS